MKSKSYLGAYGCFKCHQVVDGAVPPPDGMTRDDIRLMFLEGHLRSMPILERKGLLVTA